MSALSSSITPPEAPNPEPVGNPALMGGQQLQQQSPQQGPQIPPPSYGQTVAGLRQFMVMQREIKTLLENPETGKSDIRSHVIDLATQMVADGMSTPAAAVQQLSQFPDKPFEQKQALEKMLGQVVMAGNTILAHHQQGYAGQPVAPNENYDADSHANILDSVTNHYKGKHA